MCHSAARSVGGWGKDLMIPGKTNSKPNTAGRAPTQSSHECVGAGFLAAASRCHGGQRHWTMTALSRPRRKGIIHASNTQHHHTCFGHACDKKMLIWSLSVIIPLRYLVQFVTAAKSFDGRLMKILYCISETSSNYIIIRAKIMCTKGNVGRLFW